jgi:hypothetical protein
MFPEKGKKFARILSIYLLYFSLKCFLNREAYFDEDSWLHYNKTAINGFDFYSKILSAFPQLALFFISTLSVTSFFCLVGKWPRLSMFIMFLCYSNIITAIPAITTGGDMLVRALLFFMMFFSFGNYLSYTNVIKKTFILLSNLAIISCKIQVLLLYFFAFLFKILDADWRNGNALSNIFYSGDYAFYFSSHWFHDETVFTLSLNYIVMIFQGIFPIVVFMKHFKRYFLMLGICIHLSIAAFMGIWEFSIVMILVYYLFYE